MLLCLNPFEIRVSFEHINRSNFGHKYQSQSLRNQGFIRTRSLHSQARAIPSQSLRNQGFIRTQPGVEALRLRPVSIPSKSGFHSNLEGRAETFSKMGLNPFEIRVSFERKRGRFRSTARSLNPFEIRVSFEPGRMVYRGRFGRVSIPSKSGFHSNSCLCVLTNDTPGLNPFEIRVSFEPLRWSTVSRC